MALPLPQVVPDVQAGGPFVTQMRGMNALSSDMLKNAMMELENQYYGPSKQAEIEGRQAATEGQKIENAFSPERMRLANEYQGKVNDNYLRNLESELAARAASTNRMNTMTPLEAAQAKMMLQNPLLSKTGIAGDVGSLLYLANNPEMANKIQGGIPGQQMGQPGQQQNPMQQGGQQGGMPSMPQMGNPMQSGNMTPGTGNLLDIMKQGIGLNLKAKEVSTALNQAKAQGYTFNSLPVDYKSYLLAQGAGMGIEPNQMTKMLNEGKTVEEIAADNGFDPQNMPDLVYPLTSQGRTQLHRRQQANAEINVLGKKISDSMAPYSSRVNGYSPKQISQALQGTNKDDQAKFLAARALQPELASIRLRMMQGNVGIEAIRELTEKSMGNANAMQALVSPDVYKKSNEYIDKWLNQAVEAANSRAAKSIVEQNRDSSNSSDTPITKVINGVTYEQKGNDWYVKKK